MFFKKRLWRHVFLKFDGFEKKKTVGLCGAIWPQFFPQNLMFFKNRLWHYLDLFFFFEKNGCGIIFSLNLKDLKKTVALFGAICSQNFDVFFKKRLCHYFS